MSLTNLDSLQMVNPLNLNVNKKSGELKGDEIDLIDVQSCKIHEVSLYKNEGTLPYESLAPKKFIKEKFPFFKKREKVLKACLFFASIIQNKNQQGFYLLNTYDFNKNEF